MRTLLALLLFCNCQATESAVTRALRFLARHQAEDGCWGKPAENCRCRPRYPIDTPLGIPIDKEVEARFRRLLPQLADEGTEVRDRAQRELRILGAGAAPLLRASLDDADPEVALRCREALRTIWETDPTVPTICLGLGWSAEEGVEVTTTGLALLCFLGAGYAPYSKDEIQDSGRVIAYGTVVRKAARWLQERQADDGAFDTRDPVAHAIATTALCDLYGMTAAEMYLEPSVRAIAHLKTLESSDSTFLLWKGMALHSAHASELPDCPRTACDDLVDVLSREESRLGVNAALLLSMCGKRGTEPLRARVAHVDLKELSPLEEWLLTTVASLCRDEGTRLHGQESIWKRLPESQIRAPGCDAGSWPTLGRSWERRLLTSLYSTLTMERAYRYPCALFFMRQPQ